MSEREQNYDDETRHFPPDSDRQFGMAADEGVRQGIESIKKQVSQAMSEREAWKMSPEEIAKFEHADCADYGGGVKFDFITTDSEGLADAAAVKAREWVADWLEAHECHHATIPGVRKYCKYCVQDLVAALKGRKA